MITILCDDEILVLITHAKSHAKIHSISMAYPEGDRFNQLPRPMLLKYPVKMK